MLKKDNQTFGGVMIQIIGAGAIGNLWLAKFLQADIPCHMVSRQKRPSQQLQFTDLSGHQELINISVSQQLLDNQPYQENSIILVCVKAQHVVQALLSQRQHITAKQVIILMHNGYGCAEEVAKHFPDNPIICATTSNASLLQDTFNIRHTGQGASYFGPFNEAAKLKQGVINLFKQAMPDVHWQNDIRRICWSKLVINAVINPLTAIKQVNNGQLTKLSYQTTIKKLIKEIHTIAEAEGLSFNIDELQNNVQAVIHATTDNYSSMNRDIFFKRQTEIDYINGYLIKKALLHQLPCPLLQHYYQAIKALECHSLTPEDKL